MTNSCSIATSNIESVSSFKEIDLYAVVPHHVKVSKPTPITIYGENFHEEVMILEPQLDDVIRINSTTITATVPDNLPIGPLDFAITNPLEQSCTLHDIFVVLPAFNYDIRELHSQNTYCD